MLKFRAVKQTKAYAEIVEQIRKLIEQGKLQPGERLPSERTLSAELSIGRQSLREALSVLEAMGLLEVRHGIGTFVRQDALSNLNTIAKEDNLLLNPFELLEARRVIEIEIVNMAAKRATEQDLKEMAKALETFHNSMPKQHFELDRTLHLAFARGAHNEILYNTMLEITDQMTKHLWTTMKGKSLKILGRTEKYYQEHESILNAIKNQNSKLAMHAMGEHLENIEYDFLERE